MSCLTFDLFPFSNFTFSTTADVNVHLTEQIFLTIRSHPTTLWSRWKTKNTAPMANSTLWWTIVAMTTLQKLSTHYHVLRRLLLARARLFVSWGQQCSSGDSMYVKYNHSVVKYLGSVWLLMPKLSLSDTY